MNNKLIIFQANIADAKDILLLQKLAFTSEAELYRNYSLPPMVQSLSSVLADFEYYTFLKVEIESKIVGSVKAKMNDETCFISRLIVDPQHQNLGIGKKLMSVIESSFSFANRFELFTGKISLKNISFYEGLGYKICGESSHPGNIALVVMEKINRK